MQVLTHRFKSAARAALLDEDLREALDRAEDGFVENRRRSVEQLDNFEAFRDYGRDVKDHVLANLGFYLRRFEENVVKNGGQVHWARNGQEANRIILEICKAAGARKITKGKSMVSEEAATNAALEEQGYEVVETDLGEYIIQLAEETPSHIIAPAVHKSRHEITELFHRHHSRLGVTRRVTGREEIVDQARHILRDHFRTADVGITGANFLLADTGAVAIVTNEGNGDLTASLPGVHIVTAGLEKVIPDYQALGGFLRILGRSATGQAMSVYTTLFNGPKRAGDLDGPEEFHVILLDNGRSSILGGDYREILRCIRCGACLNHCPVYAGIGGHAYGWVYPGPVGSVLTPLLVGRARAADLPNACTLNGRCGTVCPVRIPLPQLLRRHRADLAGQGMVSRSQRIWMTIWAWLAKRPRLYARITGWAALVLHGLDRMRPAARRGRFRKLPLAGAWTATRDFPAPAGRTFQASWKRRARG